MAAKSAFEAAVEQAPTAEALLGLGEAVWWLGDVAASVRYRESAYAEFHRRKDPAQAAAVAVRLSLTYRANLGNRAACSPACSAPAKPTEVDLSLNSDGQLVQAYYQYNTSTGSYPSTPTSSTVMANGVVAADWLFLPYVEADPPAAARPQSCNGGAGLCGASAQAELDSIVQVDINFAIAAQGNEKVQSFTTSAALNRGSSA